MNGLRHRALGAFLVIWVTGGTALAAPLSLSLPTNAKLTHEEAVHGESYDLPTGPFADGAVPNERLEGVVSRQAWRVPAPSVTTLQLFAPLRDQLEEAGFTPIMECDSADCGGFDFRFGTEVLEAPDMYIDLFDFRALSAVRPGANEGEDPDYVFLLVSRAAGSGYVQLVHVTPETIQALAGEAVDAVVGQPSSPVRSPLPAGDLEEALLRDGHAVLQDLQFDTGSSRLSADEYDTLQALARFLKADPARQVVLVGHSDTEGSLDGNMSLSRRRAQAVADRLVEGLGVTRGQLSAQGIGFLAPLTSNSDEGGREENRRVEVVLLDPGTSGAAYAE